MTKFAKNSTPNLEHGQPPPTPLTPLVASASSLPRLGYMPLNALSVAPGAHLGRNPGFGGA